MKPAALAAAFAVALAGCNGCKKSTAADAGPPDAAATKGSAAISSEAWWLALPELPEGSVDLSVVMAPPARLDERIYGYLSGSFCGQEDPFFFEKPALWHQPAAGVACARRLLELDPNHGVVWTIDFNRAAHSSLLAIQLLGTRLRSTAELEPLVPGFHREQVGGVDALCRPFEEPERSCAERASEYDDVLMVHEGYLIAGKFPALEEFLKVPWSRWALAQLTRTQEAIPSRSQTVTFDLFEPGSRWMIGERRWLPYSRREETDALAEAVRADARAVAWEEDWDASSGKITLVPRCSDRSCPERERLLAAFRTYHLAWAQKAMARLEQLYADNPDDLPCRRPHEVEQLEAMKTAQPASTSSGAIVFQYAAAHPTPCATLSERDRAGVARVRALLDGGEPPDNRPE